MTEFDRDALRKGIQSEKHKQKVIDWRNKREENSFDRDLEALVHEYAKEHGFILHRSRLFDLTDQCDLNQVAPGLTLEQVMFALSTCAYLDLNELFEDEEEKA